MRALAVVSLALVVGCGKTTAPRADAGRPYHDEPPPAPEGPGLWRGPLANADAARQAFADAWDDEVWPSYVARVASRSPNKIAPYHPTRFESISRIRCRDAAMTPAPSADRARLFGRHAAIARDGDCWVFVEDNWGAPHTLAILDAETGALLWAAAAECG